MLYNYITGYHNQYLLDYIIVLYELPEKMFSPETEVQGIFPQNNW